MISRLQARLDLQIILANGELVRVTHINPHGATWRRNLPAVADELEVTLSSSLLPVDLRAVDGVRVLFWLFEHQEPARCKPGDPGFFFGVADELGRERPERTISLTCRDMTGILLDAKVTPKDLKGLDIRRIGSLEAVVKRLVGFGGPFASDWKVRSLSAAGARLVFPALSRVRAVKAMKDKGKGKNPAAVTQRRLMTLDTLVDGQETSVWEVICQLCARMGVLPELSLDASGVPEILLVDALDHQTSDTLRPFSRGGRNARALTLGRSVATIGETVRLTRDGDLPDQVVVGAWDHETGKMVEVAFPPDAKARKGDKMQRVYQVAEGSTDLATLTRVAAAAWAATRQHQLEVEVETWSPWSDGGGPQDPDLLDLGAGAGLALLVDDDYAFRTAIEVGDAFQGLPAEVLRAFERAEALRPPTLLFQVGEVTHTYAGGDSPDYACRIKLNTWLGTQP